MFSTYFLLSSGRTVATRFKHFLQCSFIIIKEKAQYLRSAVIRAETLNCLVKIQTHKGSRESYLLE